VDRRARETRTRDARGLILRDDSDLLVVSLKPNEESGRERGGERMGNI
jgi:hypothetical protein